MSLIRGRFKKEADEVVARYTASLPFDRRLFHYDIVGSIAHAKMLARQGIISAKDSRAIVKGLRDIEDEIVSGEFDFTDGAEDIHMAVEARLTEMIGPAGARLHTGRSRNDQVALDTRLFVKDVIIMINLGIDKVQMELVRLGEANQDVTLPGYTHLQRAQPVLLAHHLLAYYEMLQRDFERFEDCFRRTDVLPLGSGALAGVAYNIDRQYVAKQLGFSRISANSLDAVADRDFVIEFEAAASICMMHLSRLAMELVLWSSSEFNFIEMDDAYAHGSSIMPQKKNPDVAELARGKVGRVYGHLMGLLTTMKGLPLAYNSDMQEDKEGLFDTVDTLLSTLGIFSGMLETIRFKVPEMARALDQGYLLATDIADYLVGKGAPFRQAHEITGKLVNWAVQHQKTFPQISLKEYRQFSELFDQDVLKLTVESSMAARNNPGGTAPQQVRQALKNARRALSLDEADAEGE